MKRKILVLLNVLLILLVIALLIYSLFFEEVPDYRRISKYVAVLIGYVLAMLGIKNKRSVFDYKVYEDCYKDIVGDTFRDDKKSYRELLQVAVYYNRDEYKKAHKLLDKLETKCIETKDYSAVLRFRALCLEQENKVQQVITVYERLLQYDTANSSVWSNLGIYYMKVGRTKDAYQAYTNAVLYGPGNPYAYNNLATYYIKTGEASLALENALRALEIDARMHQAMSAAAMAYKMLGDNTNADKYCKMYGVNGGNAKDLKNVLDNI